MRHYTSIAGDLDVSLAHWCPNLKEIEFWDVSGVLIRNPPSLRTEPRTRQSLLIEHPGVLRVVVRAKTVDHFSAWRAASRLPAHLRPFVNLREVQNNALEFGAWCVPRR